MIYSHIVINFSQGPFGSSFREQIYVSTIPASCFDIVKDLDQAFKDGDVKTSVKKTIMTGGVFQCAVGLKDEVKLADILADLTNGDLSLGEFREKAKKLKVNSNLIFWKTNFLAHLA